MTMVGKLSLVCLAAACATPERSLALHLVAGMAGTNNPDAARGSGDGDNLAAGLGGRLPLGTHATLRAEGLQGDFAFLATPSLTWDFRLAGPDGPGAIDAHVGIGYAWLSRDRDHVLGNSDGLLLRVGAEGYLVAGLMGGVALLVTPFGYDDDEPAVAGLFYVGLRF
jgi:hypothetical protein